MAQVNILILEQKGSKADAKGFNMATLTSLTYSEFTRDYPEEGKLTTVSLDMSFEGGDRVVHLEGDDADETYKRIKTSFAEVVKLT